MVAKDWLIGKTIIMGSKKETTFIDKTKKERQRRYIARCREMGVDKVKEWKSRNMDKLVAYNKKKRHSSPFFNLKSRLRRRTAKAILQKGFRKDNKTEEILGATFDVIQKHIESQFVDGMNWGNRNKWHVDHIIPLSSARTEEELIALCHYSNLQPLWAEDNFKKANKTMAERLKTETE